MGSKSDGMVLLISLLVALLGLIIVGTLSLLLSSSTRFSGSLKRYSIALEAARSAVEDFRHDVERACADSGSFGNWIGISVRSKVCRGEDFCLTPPNTADQVLSHCHWSKFYGDYVACVEVVCVVRGREYKVDRDFDEHVFAEVVACKGNISKSGVMCITPEKAWFQFILMRLPEIVSQ